jgi:hypothetical protein
VIGRGTAGGTGSLRASGLRVARLLFAGVAGAVALVIMLAAVAWGASITSTRVVIR